MARVDSNHRENADALTATRVAVWEWDVASGQSHASPALGPLLGLRRGELPRRPEDLLALVHPDDRDRVREAVGRAFEQRGGHELRFRTCWPDGSVQPLLAVAEVQADGDGEPSRLVGVCQAVEEDRIAEALEAALRRTSLLAAAGTLLDASLDVETTLREVAQVVIDRLADWCSVDMLGADGVLHNVAVAHSDPEKVALAERLQVEYPPDPDSPVGAPNVVRTGEAELYADITDDLLSGGARDEVELELMRSLDLASAIIVPLSARGRTLGTLTLVGERDRHFGDADLELARELARRAALAVDNARLYAAARHQERATEEARAVLDTLIEHAPVGLAYFDEDLRYVRVNRALAQLDGLAADEHVGRRAHDVLPDMALAIEDGVRTVLRTGEPLVDVEVSGVTSAEPGRVRHFEVSYYRIALPGAQTLGVGATVVEMTERKDVEDALRAQRDLYETLLRAQSDLGEAFVLIERERILYANQAAERLAGRSAQELYRLSSFYDLLPPDQQAAIGERLTATLSEDRAERGFETAMLTPDSTRVAIEVAAKPLVVDGRRRLVVLARDISDRRRHDLERERLLTAERQARREAELAHERTSFLAEVSGVLERSMQLHHTLREVARLLADRMCDLVAIHVLSRDGTTLERVGLAARDPERDALYLTLRGTTFEADRDHPMGGVTLTGKARAYSALSAEELRETTEGPEVVALLQRVAGTSGSALPLTARGHPVGVLGLGWDEPDHVPAGEELHHFEEIARRLGLAIDNAQLYAERAHIASTLQASLLPAALPAIPGVDVAARYLPAGEASEVGGDFYDVFSVGERRWAVVVGDVCGKGAEAAAVTAMARYTLRATAAAGAAGPADAFALLNTAALSESDRFLSAVVGDVRLLGDEGAEVTIACAGHPAPLVLRGGEDAEAVAARGPLLGIDGGARWEETRVRLGPGDALVLYTDGVTEARRTEPLSAEELAAELLLPGPTASASALADAVREVAHSRAEGRLRDDVAILVLRVEPPVEHGRG